MHVRRLFVICGVSVSVTACGIVWCRLLKLGNYLECVEVELCVHCTLKVANVIYKFNFGFALNDVVVLLLLDQPHNLIFQFLKVSI